MQHVQGVASQALRTINNCRDANLSHRKRKTLSATGVDFAGPLSYKIAKKKQGEWPNVT